MKLVLAEADIGDFLDLDLVHEHYTDGTVKMWNDNRRLYALNVMIVTPDTFVFRDGDGKPLIIFGAGVDYDLFSYISKDFCKKFRPSWAKKVKEMIAILTGDDHGYKLYVKKDSKAANRFARWLGFEVAGEIPCYHNGQDLVVVYRDARNGN